MTEIVIQGIGGRMGHVLCDMIAQRDDCCVVAGIDVKDGEQNGIPVYDSLEKLNGKGDVVIDFSSPAAVEKALPYCEAHKLPILVFDLADPDNIAKAVQGENVGTLVYEG